MPGSKRRALKKLLSPNSSEPSTPAQNGLTPVDSSASIASNPSNYMSDEALQQDLEVEAMIERGQSIGTGDHRAQNGLDEQGSELEWTPTAPASPDRRDVQPSAGHRGAAHVWQCGQRSEWRGRKEEELEAEVRREAGECGTGSQWVRLTRRPGDKRRCCIPLRRAIPLGTTSSKARDSGKFRSSGTRARSSAGKYMRWGSELALKAWRLADRRSHLTGTACLTPLLTSCTKLACSRPKM